MPTASADHLGGIVDAMLSGRHGLSSTMVGRAAALARLTGLVEAVEVASCDGPELVLVSGEAGIGKTRLLREFITRLPTSVTSIVAAAQPGSLGRAFDVVSQLCLLVVTPLKTSCQRSPLPSRRAPSCS